MDIRYLPAPDDLNGNFAHVMQECGELIQAITKFQMYGAQARDPHTGRHYDNEAHIIAEMKDLEGAMARLGNTLRMFKQS
jgi:NTP pyrophosphatase (non-canonical NTP hydrolase)